MGVWGQSPQRGPGAESILVIGCPTEPANLAPLVKFSTQKIRAQAPRKVPGQNATFAPVLV